MVFLHGEVTLTVHEAKGLQAQDLFTNDAYVKVFFGRGRVHKTPIIYSTTHPQWESNHSVIIGLECEEVRIEIWDQDVGTEDDLVGKCSFPIQKLLDEKEINHEWFKIDPKGKILLSMSFVEATVVPGPIVPNTYFDAHEDCRVTLYGDAHVPEGRIPSIELAHGEYYEAQTCWKNLYDSIVEAKHFIYMVGWSVFTELTLVREEGVPTLGELLKQKAEEGVIVCIMPWDEAMSIKFKRVSNLLGLQDGLMATHDEETRRFFKKTTVQCRLSSRVAGASAKNEVDDFAWSASFTHHQKTVVLDAPCPDGDDRRRIISYMGGIDLCDGRYDTPDHDLFRTLKTSHAKDFHQANVTSGLDVSTGPREPWHDIHCRVEGRVARDIMQNFHDRWNKQDFGSEYLFEPSQCEDIILPQEERWGVGSHSWNSQVFRSIDSAVALFKGNKGLINKRGRTVDRSIQDAYIHHIRRAKHFIYIENQYFIGSAFGWSSPYTNCDNMVPAEIAIKVANKIRAGERFCAYILTPMHPEGAPGDMATQAIIHWEYLTFQMMYRIVGDALREVGSSDHPTDWLTFFCLGNRETHEGGQDEPASSAIGEKLQTTRRFMIYVHSKLMIVDDEYVIVGSANINERSQAGSRDSEICTGSWQPSYMADDYQTPQGHVYGFRAHLWTEHLGYFDELFKTPSDIECVRKVNCMAQANLAQYLADDVTEMETHLMPYLLQVNQDG
eukprot:Ihof_evm1s478 gene=Ihof_evmTU1s478